MRIRIPVTLTGTDCDGDVTGFKLLIAADGRLALWRRLEPSSPIETDDLTSPPPLLPSRRRHSTSSLTNWNGETDFQYVAIDNHNTPSANPGTATISVAAENDTPHANDIGVSTSADDFLIPVTLSGSDVDGTISGFRLSSLPAHGTLYVDYVTILIRHPRSHLSGGCPRPCDLLLRARSRMAAPDDIRVFCRRRFGRSSNTAGHVSITAAAPNVRGR